MKTNYSITHIDNNSTDLHHFESICNEMSETITLKSFSNIDQALASIAIEQPDIIVFDIESANDNGLDFIKELRQYNSKLVVLSANENEEANALELGVMHYLPKPFGLRSMRSVIRRFEQDTNISEMLEMRKAQLSGLKVKALVTSRIFVNHLHKIHTVRVCDILYMQAEKNTTRIYVKDGRELVSSLDFKHYIAEFTGHPLLVIMNKTCLVSKSCLSQNHQGSTAAAPGSDVVTLSGDQHYAVSPRSIPLNKYFNRI